MSIEKFNIFNIKQFNNFLVFLLISILFSTVVKLSKVYTKKISFKINLTDVPDNQILTNKHVDSIELTVSSYGFDFIKYYLSDQSINISSKEVSDDSQSYIITQSNSIQVIEDFIAPKFQLISANFDSLFFNYDNLITKNIPVVLNSYINFSQGFNSFKDFNLIPDSISVIGPELSLRSINSIKTKKLYLRDLKFTINQEVDLDFPNDINFKYSKKSINVFIDVEKSTESLLDIPISIINIPNDVKINYYPKSLMVSFTVSLDNFKRYTSEDFKIICDFNQIYKDGKLTPKVTSQPNRIKNLRLIDSEIQYFFLK